MSDSEESNRSYDEEENEDNDEEEGSDNNSENDDEDKSDNPDESSSSSHSLKKIGLNSFNLEKLNFSITNEVKIDIRPYLIKPETEKLPSKNY